MSTSRAKAAEHLAQAESVSFEDGLMHVHLKDGRSISVPISRFQRLQNATDEQRQKWELIGPGVGIHWEEIDEDISVENLLIDQEDLLVYE
jgi:hypothetical protein